MGGRDITSDIKLFTGSTLLNGLVHNSDNAISLKSNLDKLVQWETLWQIILSSTCWNATFYEFAEPRILWSIPTLCLAKTCHSLWTTNLILELIYQIYYDLNWTTHILNIRNKAYLALCQEELIYFAHIRLKIKPTKSLVRPMLEIIHMVVLYGICIVHISNLG